VGGPVIWRGSRFIATSEAVAAETYKQMIVHGGAMTFSTQPLQRRERQ